MLCMTRLFTIFLLLISFQANAIAGAQMMSTMAALAMSSETQKHTAHNETDTHLIDHQEKEGCDKHCDCGLCSGHYFKAVLFQDFNIPPIGQFDFESDYLFSGVPIIHLLHLKPPKRL